MLKPEKEAQLIMDRIKPVFKKLRGHTYQILIVNSPYLDHYGVYLEDNPINDKYSRARSTSLYSYDKSQGKEGFIEIINELKKLTNLTIFKRGDGNTAI